MNVKSKVRMTLEHFHDFYYLQALRAEIRTEIVGKPELQFSRSVDKLLIDVDEASERITQNIALRTFVYLYAACAGEARHSRSNVCGDMFIPQIVEQHRGEVYENIYLYRPDKDNLNTLVRVFNQSWRGGYGGRAWRDIAQAIKMYYTLPPAAFIDHVIDLEHNGGCVFSKDDACMTLLFDVRYEGFKNFLDYKFRYNILSQAVMNISVTREVYKLVQRYSVIFHKKMPDWISPHLKKLDDYEIQWQDNHFTTEHKWHEWVDVTSGNKPTASSVLTVLNVHRIYFPKHTADEIKAIFKGYKKDARAILGDFKTRALTQKVNKALDEYMQENIGMCKVKKAKVTYSTIPCQITKLGTSAVVQAFVPHENVGIKVSDGFVLKTPSYHMTLKNGEPYDGHFYMTYGEVYLATNGKTFVFPNKELEAILE